jgi:hypothetical protein
MFDDNVLCHGGPYCGAVEYAGQLQTPVGVSQGEDLSSICTFFQVACVEDFLSFPINHFQLRKRVSQLTDLVNLLTNASFNDKVQMCKLRLDLTVTALGPMDVPFVDDQLRATRATVLANMKMCWFSRIQCEIICMICCGGRDCETARSDKG